MREGDDVSELDDVQTTIGAIDGRRRLLLRLWAASHGRPGSEKLVGSVALRCQVGPMQTGSGTARRSVRVGGWVFAHSIA